MERLTKKAWRNLDPWECCGQDHYCKRDCHDEGGCNKGCIVPKLYDKLAAYEDAGLEPDEIARRKEDLHVLDLFKAQSNDAEESIRIAKARREGRFIVLPCKVGDILWIVSTSFNPQIVKTTMEWISAQFQENGFAIDLYARSEDGVGWSLTDYNIGKTVFLTREEAEKALEGMNNG